MPMAHIGEGDTRPVKPPIVEKHCRDEIIVFVTKGKAWGKSMRNRVVRAVVSGTPWGVKVQTARELQVLTELST